jgi:LmbE family N-acetylglucosaminyl deacetylase
MERRKFLSKTIAGGAFLGGGVGLCSQSTGKDLPKGSGVRGDELVVERDAPGQPHKGKVLAAIQPHADDIPIFAAGTIAKLIREGYAGYLIRTTNDDHAGPGTVGDTVVANELDNEEVARALGLNRVFNLDYRNHRMEDIDIIELKARLIFLFRVLKVDTVISYDPWGHDEENPDHWVTGRVAEEACWMSGMGNEYPEHMAAGLRPHTVKERYYFVAKPGQPYNRVVDTSSSIDRKIAAIVECRSQGRGDRGSRLRAELAREGRRLPILGNDDRTADREYVRHFLLDQDKTLGRQYGLEYAEPFLYTDQRLAAGQLELEDYIKRNAVPL